MISSFIVSYLALVQKLRYAILFLWLVILFVSGFYAMKFPADVYQNIDPPHDSPSSIAKRRYNDKWADQADNTAFVIFAESQTETPITNISGYDTFDAAVEFFAYTGNLSFSKYNFPLSNLTQDEKRGVTYSSARSVIAANLPDYVADAFFSRDRSATKMTVTYPHPADSAEAKQFSKDLQAALDFLAARYGLSQAISANAFGMLPFLDSIQGATGKDVFTMFAIVLPISLIVFGFSLSALRYVLLPVVTLIVTLSVVYGLMDGVANNIPVNSMVPGIAGAFTLALVIDYTYFIMCKFRKQVRCAGDMRVEAILPLLELVMSSAGRSVFTSALAIASCALGLVFFPVEMFRSIGICCIISPITAMLVVLNLIPAMLLAFPTFFMNGAKPNCDSDDDEEEPPVDTHLSGVFQPLFADSTFIETIDEPNNEATGARRSVANIEDGEGTALRSSRAYGTGDTSSTGSSPVKPNNNSNLSADGGRGRGAARTSARSTVRSPGRHSTMMSSRSTIDSKHNVSRHYRLVEFITRFPTNIIFTVLILALCITPCVYAFTHNNASNDITQFIPRDSPLLPAWSQMQNKFAAGDVFPYFLLIDLSPSGLQFNRGTQEKAQEGYDLIQGLLTSFLNRFPDMPHSSVSSGVYNGVAYATDPSLVNYTYSGFIQCFFAANAPNPNPTPDCIYQMILTTKVFASLDLSWTYALISPTFDPTSAEGVQFYHDFLELIPELEATYNVSLYLSGYGAETEDIVSYSNKTLPKIAAIVAAILFVFVALAFGSIGIPLRAVFTVSLSTMVVFGLVNIIFVVKAFNFLGWNGLLGNGSVAWSVPYAVFLIIVGISLNYALISMIRVLEFYWLGVPTKQAIRFGVADTGREITVAALMMFIVFFGMLFSQVPAMNELGMYLVLTSIVSGLVFRLFLSPPLMSLLGEYNWWPMNSCNSFMWKFTPLVLPTGAAKTRATFHSDDFYDDEQGAAAGGEVPNPSQGTSTVYRSSTHEEVSSDRL